MTEKDAVSLQIERGYGLAVVEVDRAPGGYLHQTFRLRTDRGLRFLKVYSGPDWPASRVETTLQIQQFLALQGHPVPAVEPGRSGSLVVLAQSDLSPEGEGVMALMAFLPGRRLEPAEISDHGAFSAGQALGRLHQTLHPEAQPPDAGQALPFIPDPEHVALQAEQLAASAGGRCAQDEMDHLAIAAAEYRLESLRRRPIDPNDYADAIWQTVHGDFYPGNWLFDGHQNLSGVVDFDFCGPRWRAMEVARAAVETALRSDGSLYAPAARAVLQGYLTENQLRSGERRQMFRFWHDYLLFSLYPLPLRYSGAAMPHGWQALARRRHRLLTWLGAHLDDLQALAAGI